MGILTSFVVLTAVGGGVAILTKVDNFPNEWLHSTPFKTYTIPAFLLSVVVGGSAAAPAINVIFKKKNALRYSIISGIFFCAYIIVEILILKQIPPRPTPIEIFYLIIGIIILVLAFLSSRNK